MDDWPLSHDSFEAVAKGLERTYRRGRRAFKAALEEPSAEALHEWRKRVKDLWYEHTLLRELWPPVMSATGDEAHELSDRLGDDHDLVVLAAWVRGTAIPTRISSTRSSAGGRSSSGRRSLSASASTQRSRRRTCGG